MLYSFLGFYLVMVGYVYGHLSATAQAHEIPPTGWGETLLLVSAIAWPIIAVAKLFVK